MNVYELLKEIRHVVNGVRIDEVIKLPSLEQIRNNLSNPDMRPGLFDVTLEAWLHRISLWGKVTIVYFDPENNVKQEVSQTMLIKKLSDPNLLKMLGQWDIQELELTKIVMSRKYRGMNGDEYVEKFIVSIDLKPEIKKALSK